MGGSTTAGYNCTANSSSWPDELDKLGLNLEIKNYGVNGSNSDYTLKRLKTEMALNNIPNVVLFANWINEIDVLSEGFDQNKNYFRFNFPQFYEKVEGSKISKSAMFFSRLDKTFTEISLFYLITGRVVRNNLNNTDGSEQVDPADLQRNSDDIKISIKNYELNLIKIYNILSNKGCKLIIIRPPICWDIYNKNHKEHNYYKWVQRWDDEMNKFVMSFCKTNNVIFIDTQEAYSNDKNMTKYFCDGVHQNFQGHRIMGDYIYKNLTLGE